MQNRKQIISEIVSHQIREGLFDLPKDTAEKKIMNQLGQIDKKFEFVSDRSWRRGPAVMRAAGETIRKQMPRLKRQRATLLGLLDRVRGGGPNNRAYQSELG